MKDIMCLNKECESRATCKLYVSMPQPNTVYVVYQDDHNCTCTNYSDVTEDEPARPVKMVDESIENSPELRRLYDILNVRSD